MTSYGLSVEIFLQGEMSFFILMIRYWVPRGLVLYSTLAIISGHVGSIPLKRIASHSEGSGAFRGDFAVVNDSHLVVFIFASACQDQSSCPYSP